MEWISDWIQGIIIAVIISTIIEMILPEGTSKKYIKVVIGVYILFSIVSPVISKITGNKFRVSDIFDLDEYIETSKNSANLQNQLTSQNQDQIKEIYLSSIKNDICEKIENKGYTVSSIEIEVEDDEQYTLNKLSLQISKVNTDNTNSTETADSNQITTIVNEVKINDIVADTNTTLNMENSSNTNTNSSDTSSSSADSSKSKKENISEQAKKELKEYLSSVYEISTKKVFINE